jgi:hypothetical protein
MTSKIVDMRWPTAPSKTRRYDNDQKNQKIILIHPQNAKAKNGVEHQYRAYVLCGSSDEEEAGGTSI